MSDIKKLPRITKLVQKIKSILPIIITAILLISFLGVFLLSYDSGKIDTAKQIRHINEVVENLASSEVQSQLIEFFPERLNYTQLFVWESARINFTQNRDTHTDPLEILETTKMGKNPMLCYTWV